MLLWNKAWQEWTHKCFLSGGGIIPRHVQHCFPVGLYQKSIPVAYSSNQFDNIPFIIFLPSLPSSPCSFIPDPWDQLPSELPASTYFSGSVLREPQIKTPNILAEFNLKFRSAPGKESPHSISSIYCLALIVMGVEDPPEQRTQIVSSR